jgi:DNA-binding NarL/FixJ family response regulator
MEKIRIIIADEHPIMRLGLKYLLSKDEVFTTIGEATNSEELLGLLTQKSADMVILDLKIPEIDKGISAVKMIKRNYVATKIVIISQLFHPSIIDKSMMLGVDAYLSKKDLVETIHSTLKIVAAGRLVVVPRINMMHDNNNFFVEKLTYREAEILKLIVNGKSRKEIAAEMDIAISTVDFHRQNIKGKIGANNSADIVRISAESGFI